MMKRDKKEFVKIMIRKNLLKVNPETGEIFGFQIPLSCGTRITGNGRKIKGANVNGKKQSQFVLCGRTESVYHHDVIWIAIHGDIPDGLVIDHIDRNPSNNKICNLRCVTQKENMANSKWGDLKRKREEKCKSKA